MSAGNGSVSNRRRGRTRSQKVLGGVRSPGGRSDRQVGNSRMAIWAHGGRWQDEDKASPPWWTTGRCCAGVVKSSWPIGRVWGGRWTVIGGGPMPAPSSSLPPLLPPADKGGCRRSAGQYARCRWGRGYVLCEHDEGEGHRERCGNAQNFPLAVAWQGAEAVGE